MVCMPATSGEWLLKAHCLPFSQIPHTTQLLVDFLSYSPQVQPFYPHSPYFRDWIKKEAKRISYDPSRRERVTAILDRQNKSWSASPQALANIDRLRAGACAVVTGQQVGLFGGPMFAIYKAFTAAKLAEEATAAGVDAVPVFWLATYDHDLAEVNHVSMPGPDGNLRTLSTSSHGIVGAPVGDVRLCDEILPVVDEAVSLLGDNEISQSLREAYRPGETLGSAFARFYAKLLAPWGVILLDAADPELHRVAEPIYHGAIENAETLTKALLDRGAALEHAGYFQQVKVTESSVLLFVLRDGARTPIHKKNEGQALEFVFGAGANAEKVSPQELLRRIAAAPENFSANVLLRPVVQDYLLPTLAYTGGAAEAAYFAQAGAVYETLANRVTPFVPRFSATLLNSKLQHKLQHYGISVPEVFRGLETLRRTLAAQALPDDLRSAFDKTNRSVAESFSALKELLAKLDSTLADAADTGASKIQYQFDRLRERAAAAELRRSEVVRRHAEILSNFLYPEDGLQERGIAGAYFLAREGEQLLGDIYAAIHTDCHDHQILEF